MGQFFDQPGKITDIPADPVKPVYDNHLKLPFLRRLHHFSETGPVQIAAGKAFIFIDYAAFRRPIAIMGTDIIFAEFYLIANALALSGKFGFSGIDCDAVVIFFHFACSSQHYFRQFTEE